MERIVDGIRRFRKEIFPGRKHLFQQLAAGQNPQALFITCADSRVVPDLITQTDPGDLFICRIVGNMVPPYRETGEGVSSTIEYAVQALKVEHVIVCGHTDCGAMKGLLHPEKLDNLTNTKSWLAHGELARQVVKENYPNLSGAAQLQAITEENVVAQLDHLRTYPCIAPRLARGEINLHGWVYNIASGAVTAWDAQRPGFVAIEEYNFVANAPKPRVMVAD